MKETYSFFNKAVTDFDIGFTNDTNTAFLYFLYFRRKTY
jgi:hypothetical protein